ncbi:MAG: class I SAM-dependent methyltransferase [Desulfobacterales bacterium]|nr:class I SAM-dependent methyltransferase [Desulfobacterales bacterium]
MLEEAAVAKYDRICGKLALRAGDHILEIGIEAGAVLRSMRRRGADAESRRRRSPAVNTSGRGNGLRGRGFRTA